MCSEQNGVKCAKNHANQFKHCEDMESNSGLIFLARPVYRRHFTLVRTISVLTDRRQMHKNANFIHLFVYTGDRQLRNDYHTPITDKINNTYTQLVSATVTNHV